MKKLIVSQKSSKNSLKNYKKALKASRRGHLKSDHFEISFDDKKELIKFMKNFGILSAISIHKPISVLELAKVMGRDLSRLSHLVRFYEEVGVVQMVSTNTGNWSKMRPVVVYDRIEFDLNP